MKKLFTVVPYCLLLCFNAGLYAQSYCVPTFSGSFVYIDHFAVHTLVNNYSGTSAGGYVSYPATSFTTDLAIGNNFPITISSDYPAGIYGKFAAWIDFDNDSIFSPAELVHYDSLTHYTTSGFISIPNNPSYIGQRRLRIVYAWYPVTVTPCGSFSHGEAEDYIVNITAGPADSLTYCIPFNPFNMDNFIIDTFDFNTITNGSSGSNFTNYILYPDSLFTTTVYLNGTYPVYVAKGSTAGNTGGYAVWIDLNNDGEFTLQEQLFTAGPGLTAAAGTITIPNDTSYVGPRRLRVRSQWGNVPTDPCGLVNAGEAEDYIVNILSAPTGMENIDVDIWLKIYPNPAEDYLYLSTEKQFEGILEIYNVQNKLFFSSNIYDSDKINISFLTPGFYFVIAKTDRGKAVKTFIKK